MIHSQGVKLVWAHRQCRYSEGADFPYCTFSIDLELPALQSLYIA